VRSVVRVVKCIKIVSAVEDLANAGVDRELLRRLLSEVERICDEHLAEYPQLLDQLRALRERLNS
jgi:hypothetical protein